MHWSDGLAADGVHVAARLAPAARLFLIDATQDAGVLSLDVTQLDPDFVIFPTYKWLLGPYGRAFLYVAKRHQDSIPLEQTPGEPPRWRRERGLFLRHQLCRRCQRFDMGERDHFISLEMAAIGMEMIAEWGAAAIAQRLAMLTDRIAEGVRDLGVRYPPRKLRAPHILCLGKDVTVKPLVEGLATEGIFVAPRLGRMRVSPARLQRRDRCRPFCRGAGLTRLRDFQASVACRLRGLHPRSCGAAVAISQFPPLLPFQMPRAIPALAGRRRGQPVDALHERQRWSVSRHRQ